MMKASRGVLGAVVVGACSLALAVSACGDSFGSESDGQSSTTSATTTNSTSSSGQQGGGGTATTSDTTATPCGDHPEPASVECPGICTGGCDKGTCVVVCSGDNYCGGTTTCPEGMNCQVTCTGFQSCGYEIHCNDDYWCQVTCNGEEACPSLEIVCGARSDCSVTCGATAPTTNCTSVIMHCGKGKCLSQCYGQKEPELICGDACACDKCINK